MEPPGNFVACPRFDAVVLQCDGSALECARTFDRGLIKQLGVFA